ncbi:ABC transporter family protein, putative [Medicago truncatula]|uniref:ABC transporter family protein, putative n=1 Tax=Medicago truncatula TaxID=3880 RepID=A0A072V965_MEDTR|nr:ABC transporter family protein, putative [Medicago truncatula]
MDFMGLKQGGSSNILKWRRSIDGWQGFLNVELKGVKTVVVDLNFSEMSYKLQVTVEMQRLVRVSITAIGDTIAVIKNGEVAEKGRHEVLMKITVGVYASLVAFHSSASYLLL